MNGKYICYETKQCMTVPEWESFYKGNVDHSEYQDFADWWHDMRKSGVLEVR